MKKETAVEWLKKELEEYGSSSHLSLDWETFDKLVDQAKAMEREQIIDAYDIGCNDGIKSMYDVYQVPSSQQYYTETYKGGEQ